MTIDEAIRHYQEVADKAPVASVRDQYLQVVNWLKELRALGGGKSGQSGGAS